MAFLASRELMGYGGAENEIDSVEMACVIIHLKDMNERNRNVQKVSLEMVPWDYSLLNLRHINLQNGGCLLSASS